MGAAIALRGDFDGPGLRRLAKAAKDAGQGRRCLALAEIYDGGARWDAARMSGVGLSGDPGLGAAFQWLWAERTDRPQGIGPGAQARRRATPGACAARRGRADPGDPWRGALAPQGPGTMDIGGIPHLARRDDRGPGVEGTGVCQDFGTPASHCAKRMGHRGF